MSAISTTANRREHHLAGREDAWQAGQPGGIAPAAYFRWKGLLDRCLAAALLVPGLPIIALLVLLVRLTSRGPGIYRQARVGKHGRNFMMYKIRTMRHDAEAGTGPVWTQVRDPRITFLGGVLRKLHLDELPQLYNVLKGEMSLVGPRPERPEFVHVLAEEIPGYRNRLAVRPGVTGLAQVNLPPDTDLHSVRRKLVLDCQYIQSAGLWLDFRLFVCTIARMFRISLVGLLGLRREAILPGPPDPSADADPLISSPAVPHVPHSNGNGHANGNGQVHGNGQTASHAGDDTPHASRNGRRPR